MMIKNEIIKKEKIRKAVKGIGAFLAVAVLFLLALALYQEHIKHSVQVVDVPPELLSEGLLDWEAAGSVIEPDTTSYPLGKQCFCYSGLMSKVYYIPTVTFHYCDITEGIPQWACCVFVRKITMRNGEIVKNSFLEWNKMKLEVTIDTGGGADFNSSTGQLVDGRSLRGSLYSFHTHQIRHEINYPLAKANQEGNKPYLVKGELMLLLEHIRKKPYEQEKPYEGFLEIVCSIGKKRIEREVCFEYQLEELSE